MQWSSPQPQGHSRRQRHPSQEQISKKKAIRITQPSGEVYAQRLDLVPAWAPLTTSATSRGPWIQGDIAEEPRAGVRTGCTGSSSFRCSDFLQSTLLSSDIKEVALPNIVVVDSRLEVSHRPG